MREKAGHAIRFGAWDRQVHPAQGGAQEVPLCMRGVPKSATGTVQPDLYTEANMNYPGPPRGRHADKYWTDAKVGHVAADAGLSESAAKRSFFAKAQELFARASFAEELLVTRFRTYMVVRRAPHQHVKFRGHTITHLQHVEELGLKLPRDSRTLAAADCDLPPAWLHGHVGAQGLPRARRPRDRASAHASVALPKPAAVW